MAAAAPLSPNSRAAFLRTIAANLCMPVIGPGVLHRAIVAAQREHFDPPKFSTTLTAPRSRRSG
jgi:hypothetical protein